MELNMILRFLKPVGPPDSERKPDSSTRIEVSKIVICFISLGFFIPQNI